MTTHLADPAPSHLERDLAQAVAEPARPDTDQPLGQHVHGVADLAAGALPGTDAIPLLLVDRPQRRLRVAGTPADADGRAPR